MPPKASTRNSVKPRKGSGRPTFFRGKSATSEQPLYRNVQAAMSILMTPEGRKILNALTKKLTKEYQALTGNEKARVSRNAFIEGLTRVYGPKLKISDLIREDGTYGQSAGEP